MSQSKNKNGIIALMFEEELKKRGITTYVKNQKGIPGKPDFAFSARKIAVFCDGNFWHGFNWEKTKKNIQINQDSRISKVEKNMARDQRVNDALVKQGWQVYRFWEHEIKNDLGKCVEIVEDALRVMPSAPYKMIDLCAGIGGIRKGFELTDMFRNVLAAEVDKYACQTYRHLFGDDPYNDLISDDFKDKVCSTDYDVLLAGFPCQTFSRVGKEEGFEDKTKGQIFFHIAEIIQRTRPSIVFLENVDRLVSHDNGKTFRIIIDTLVKQLGYYVIGVGTDELGALTYNPKSFVRNSRDFGVPQNRPRTYIIAFDTERFSLDKLKRLPSVLPEKGSEDLYSDLNDVLDHNVEPKYYMASGYFETLVKHRKRQEGKGYGFGYRIVNSPEIERPVANTLLATGGSGKERNLIYDPKEGIAGMTVRGKKSPLNDQGIRFMTPQEWGKLQGVISYAFVNKDGIDEFSFPEGMPDAQKYKQFGNSVTIPVIKSMAEYILSCISRLSE